jgi:hypothetical protein
MANRNPHIQHTKVRDVVAGYEDMSYSGDEAKGFLFPG